MYKGYNLKLPKYLTKFNFYTKNGCWIKKILEQFFPIRFLVGKGAPEKFEELRKDLCRAWRLITFPDKNYLALLALSNILEPTKTLWITQDITSDIFLSTYF